MKLKFKILIVGHMPLDFAKDKVSAWKSDVFELIGPIDDISLSVSSDGEDWSYSDNCLSNRISNRGAEDILLALVNIPLEENFFCRRLTDNKVVLTFHQVGDFLTAKNIPLENLVFRVLYYLSLLYLRNGNCIPDHGKEYIRYHDETRRCLFDFNGIKHKVTDSCADPVICDDCKQQMSTERVTKDKSCQQIEKSEKSENPRTTGLRKRSKNNQFCLL